MNDRIAIFEELKEAEMRLKKGVVASDVTWMSQIAHEEFIVGNIAEGVVFYFDAKAIGWPWMVSGMGINRDISHFNRLTISEFFEHKVGMHFVKADGKIGVGEHFSEEFLSALFKSYGGIDDEVALWTVEGSKKRKASNMIPMGMTND